MFSSKVLTRILSLILVLVMALSLTACGAKDANDTSTTVVDQEVLDEYNDTRAADVYGSFAAEVEALYEEEHKTENPESKVKNEYDISYLGWTYYEYATAKESEKEQCAKAYMGYIGDLLGLKVGDTDAETLEEIKDALGNALKNNEELSVREIVLYFYASEENNTSK